MAILKGNILTFQIAEVAQALSENLPDWRVVDDANRCYLMRARSEWPRGHAAQRRYEFSATKVECHVTLPWGLCHARKELIPQMMQGKQAEIEVTSLKLGDQIEESSLGMDTKVGPAS
jgi:hypothetical protein